MGLALDRLKKSVSMQPERKSIELPDKSEFEFWMTPLTMAQRARAQKQAKGDDPTDFALQLLAMKAINESGQKLFQAGEIAELRNELPTSVVDGLILALLSDNDGEEDEEEETDMKSTRKSTKK